MLAISVEGTDDAKKTQESFPHLLVIADQGLGLCKAVDLVHAAAGPGGEDIAAPTTIIVDNKGTVRWMYRTREVFARLAPDDVLQAVDSSIH